MRTKKYFTVKGFNQQGECVYKVITEMDSTTLTEKELACNY